MKFLQLYIVFLILASVLFVGCTDLEAKSSAETADLTMPTLAAETPDSSQNDPQETTTLNIGTSTTDDGTGITESADTTEESPEGIPVEEDPTIVASGDFELIGGD